MCLYFLVTIFIVKRLVSSRLKQVSSHPSPTTDHYFNSGVWDREIENIYENIREYRIKRKYSLLVYLQKATEHLHVCTAVDKSLTKS